MKKTAIFLVFVLLFCSDAFAVIPQHSMRIFAVTTEGTAVSAELTVFIEPGTGKIWSSVTPLVGTSTQTTERNAVQIAKDYFSETEKYDYKFNISSNASLVEGPSAGAAMGLIVISMLKDKNLSEEVSITGTLSETGDVGAVGGVFEKAKAAASSGIKLFMIPQGEAKQLVKLPSGVQTISLPSYAAEEWGIKVVEVAKLDDVLKLAFSDIQEIDINATVKPEKEFTPLPITYPENLNAMHAVAKNMVNEAALTTKDARTSVSNSLIEDASQTDFLLSVLNDAEYSIKEAQTQLDSNYLYSAANNAFLAKVYASLVKDIADNPSILEEDSTLFEMRLNALRQEIQNLRSNLDEFVPIDKIDWYIGAQQRLSWADLKAKNLAMPQIIITVDGSGSETLALERIKDYEYAVAWYEAAREFFEIAKSSSKKVYPDDYFRDYSTQAMVNAENGLKILTEEDMEDAQRRLEAAKLDKEQGWHIAAAFDSASSLALIDSYNDSKDKSFDELRLLLKEKIDSVEAKINQNSSPNHSYIWVQLYLDHAKYFFDSAEFYAKEEQQAKAMDKLKSGISLIYLADYLSTVSEDTYKHYDSFTEADYIQEDRTLQKLFPQSPYFVFGVALVSFFAALAFFALVSFVYRKKIKGYYSLQEQLDAVRKLHHRLDGLFFEGKVSEEKHYELAKKYKEQEEKIEKEIEFKSKNVVEIDRLKAEMIARTAMLHQLKKQHNAGVISEAEYNRAVKNIDEEKKEMQKSIQKEKEELQKEAEEEKVFSKKTLELKKETKKEEKSKSAKKGKREAEEKPRKKWPKK